MCYLKDVVKRATKNCVKNIKKDSIIINEHLPICKNCIYYNNNQSNINSNYKSLCEKFGYKDLLTGNIKYSYAETSRSFESHCGENGRYFVEKNNIIELSTHHEEDSHKLY